MQGGKHLLKLQLELLKQGASIAGNRGPSAFIEISGQRIHEMAILE